MKIVMFTNTYTPHIGGVARSVAGLAEGLRKLGHQVLIVAPEFEDMPADETDVLRMPAIQHFAGSDFSAPAPISSALSQKLADFEPDIVHSHHPFLLGDTALRTAATYDLPTVFTYHTRYELYGHYVAQNSPALQRLVLSLATGYCALCDTVIAPSDSIAQFLSGHDVKTPIVVIPTGIDESQFTQGNRAALRNALGIGQDAFVVGHVGRLAKEKNLEYLTAAIKIFLASHEQAHFIVAGQGDMTEHIKTQMSHAGFENRLHLLGALEGSKLADTYAAMDVFAFSSCSETQGLVLAEAMTAGVPVIALDAPGAREIISDGNNGRLLPAEAPPETFAEAITRIAALTLQDRQSLQKMAKETAKSYSRVVSVEHTLALYTSLLAAQRIAPNLEDNLWQTARRTLNTEWDIISNLARAIGDAVIAPDE